MGEILINRHLDSNINQDNEVPNDLQIMNLTNKVFSKYHLQVLKKGLNYVPKPKFNAFEWVKDIHLFTRKLALKKFHAIQLEKTSKRYGLDETDQETLAILADLFNVEPTNTKFKTELMLKSKFTPWLTEYSHLDTFCKLVCNEIDKVNTKELQDQIDNNMTPDEQQALLELRDMEDIVIKKSNKGGNIVILDNDQYCNMVLKILEDTNTYQVLSTNPTDLYSSELRNILNEALGQDLISKNEFQFMNPNQPTISTFYALPKMHKGKIPPPGRRIVSDRNNLTQNSSIYIDKVLRRTVDSLPSYIRDTKQMLKILNETPIPEECMLCSIDVESLYSSIPHELGLKCVQYFIEKDERFSATHQLFVIHTTVIVYSDT
uniref:Reverse transcriptase domain-containing protein n=1 Tax=Leptobrachium leishanense TaxID=445787 RepID=A0A8C5QJI9_9ANUR